MKTDAIVLRETEAIMVDLPHELRQDEEILDAVITSLQQGLSVHSVRLDALEIAALKLEAKVDKGFELVSNEFQKVRHEAELDRVHAEYAKATALEAKATAEQALNRTHEIATTAAVADAKADGAAKMAGRNNFGWGLDPMTATICTMSLVLIIGLLISSIKDQKEPKEQGSVIKCGVDVSCTYDNRPQPANNRGGV